MEYKVKTGRSIPAPGQYLNITLNAIKTCAPRGKFSQAPRNMDITSFNAKDKLYVGFRLE